MKAKEIWKFPVPSTSMHSCEARLSHTGADSLVQFDYYDKDQDIVVNSGILFECVQAHRHLCEKFLGAKSEEVVKTRFEAYDTLVEYEDSDWVMELREVNKAIADLWNIKHYAILLDSSGIFEFIARGYKIIEPKEGPLEHGL